MKELGDVAKEAILRSKTAVDNNERSGITDEDGICRLNQMNEILQEMKAKISNLIPPIPPWETNLMRGNHRTGRLTTVVPALEANRNAPCVLTCTIQDNSCLCSWHINVNQCKHQKTNLQTDQSGYFHSPQYSKAVTYRMTIVLLFGSIYGPGI